MKYLFLLLLLSCAGGNKADKNKIDVSDLGWEFFNYPRTSYQPGYVYRIPKGSKTPQYVTTLRSENAFDTGYASLPNVWEKKTFNGNGFLKFLFLNPSDTNVSVTGNRTTEVSMHFGEAFEESMDEPTIETLVKNSQISWREKNTYYIIQSTLSTKSMQYKSENSGGANWVAGLVTKPIQAGGAISKDRKDSTVLNQDFATRYRILYKAIKITPTGAASSSEKVYSFTKEQKPTVND